jgi:AcrR family transcriptional regulator
MAPVNKLTRGKVRNRTNRSKRPESPPSAPRAPAADRRVARTRSTLHEAFIGLVLEKGFDAITIQDIVDRANVGRSTLYNHHGGKEGLLRDGLGTLREMLLTEQRSTSIGEPATDRLLRFSGMFFSHVYEYRDVFHALMKRGGEAIVMDGLKRLLTDLVKAELQFAPKRRESQPIPPGLLVRFVVDSFVSVTLWWLGEAQHVTPVEANALFRRLVLPTLR